MRISGGKSRIRNGFAIVELYKYWLQVQKIGEQTIPSNSVDTKVRKRRSIGFLERASSRCPHKVDAMKEG